MKLQRGGINGVLPGLCGVKLEIDGHRLLSVLLEDLLASGDVEGIVERASMNGNGVVRARLCRSIKVSTTSLGLIFLTYQ